ncbi:prepilin peptidase [Gordonia polyisoprenivorans]|uniref:prepilin peptidase n=1 Tax=Gordonia polyisoprenivorans TaxID=84595 RepID=UPI001AD621E1|nr:A24 family peptidase [Gordonia polyisoprenivorans]QTI67018.1 prepilin peptidase [Gordonia polyisoprenivorans]
MVAAALVVMIWLAVIAECDRRTARIPNRLLVPGVLAVLVGGLTVPHVLIAALAGSGPYLLAFARRWCGGADVKLGFVLGGLLAHPLAALLMVALAQVGVLIGHRRAGPVRRPHGPTLILAAVLVLALG